jgi:hypothetical protein
MTQHGTKQETSSVYEKSKGMGMVIARAIIAFFLFLALLTGASPEAIAMTSKKPSDNSLAVAVREANARFSDVSVAVAEGYAPIPCASGVDGGAMGVHYVNAKYLDDETPDIRRPQAVMYEPTVNGKMSLVAVEYISFKGPASLKGQLFSFTNAPNRYGLKPFYELHVWAWRPNPKGVFADMNPNVTCEHAHMH